MSFIRCSDVYFQRSEVNAFDKYRPATSQKLYSRNMPE